jgi:hypothetical protein
MPGRWICRVAARDAPARLDDDVGLPHRVQPADELPMTSRFCRWLAICLCASMQACVYLPRSTEHYDAECRLVGKHLVLEGTQVGAIQNCANQECLALVVLASVVTAATVIVSGSIVVIGNVAYWFERKIQCQAEP